MEWIDRLNRAVEYVEHHLEEPDWQEAAGIACCSPYHSQRMFALLAGMSLSEYVRRRRMSRAAASSAPAAEGLEEYTVPALTWAVFPGGGDSAEAVQRLQRRVVTEWLPTSGYEYAEGPDVEVYLNPECTKFEVWIPVVKAKQ